MKPLVSVIVPTFNRAHCLPVALASALAQDTDRYEVVVVDDASTDHTGEVVEKFTKAYPDQIRCVTLPDNQGVSAARNAGIEAAKGELITFLDSDDIYYPNKVRTQREFLLDIPEAMLCTSFYATTGDIFDPLDRRFVEWPNEEELYPNFLRPRAVRIVTPAVMVRAADLKAAGGFASDMRICEDLDLWARLLQQGPSLCVPDYLVCIGRRIGETVRYGENILARDDLYQRVAGNDPSLDDDVINAYYHELVDLYVDIATYSGSSAKVISILQKMKHAGNRSHSKFVAAVRALAKTLKKQE